MNEINENEMEIWTIKRVMIFILKKQLFYESMINKYVLQRNYSYQSEKKIHQESNKLSIYPAFLSKRDQTLSYKIIIYQRNLKIFILKYSFIEPRISLINLQKKNSHKEDYCPIFH